MRAALDTNILVYAEEQTPKGVFVRRLIPSVQPERVFVPVQVYGEFYNVLIRRVRLAPAAALQIIARWRSTFACGDITQHTLPIALDLSVAHHLSIWDAVILAAAAEAECELLLSEDLQDGFRWRGVTVTNPFADPISPLLDAFLAQR